MAKQIITKLLDDLDGGDADETLTFALDGMGYQIDLSSKNSKRVRDFLDEFIQAATRTGRVGSGPQLQRHRPSGATAQHYQTAVANREQNQAIREWATKNGYQLAERGRIPQHIADAYEKGEANPAAVAALVEEQQAADTPAKKTAARKAGSRVVDFKPEKVA